MLPTSPPTPPPIIFELSIPRLFAMSVAEIEATAAITITIMIFILYP